MTYMENSRHIHNIHCLKIHSMWYYASNGVYQIDPVENSFHHSVNLQQRLSRSVDKIHAVDFVAAAAVDEHEDEDVDEEL